MTVFASDGVGRRIAYYRSVVRPKMTQRQLADAAGVALGTIRRIEGGERGVTELGVRPAADPPDDQRPCCACQMGSVRVRRGRRRSRWLRRPA